MPYRWILFDLDGTLFDYERAEAAALTATWDEHGLPADERLLPVYRRVNGELWRQFELGRIEQATIPRLRFARLLEALGHDADPGRLGTAYLAQLGRQTQLLDGALELVEELAERFQLALLTNGLAEVQRPRLAASPLGRLFPVVVISGEIGAAKPHTSFFDAAFEAMGRPPRETALMVGDSLSSDIAGGRGYGLDTCWLNPNGDRPDDGARPTYQIRALTELRRIV